MAPTNRLIEARRTEIRAEAEAKKQRTAKPPTKAGNQGSTANQAKRREKSRT
jgi:hypothetical protein